MALSLVLALTLVLALVRNIIFSKVRVLVLNQPIIAPSKINTLRLVRNFETDPMQSTILRKNPKNEKRLREKNARKFTKNYEKNVKKL